MIQIQTYVRPCRRDKRHIYSRGEWKRKRSLSQLTPPPWSRDEETRALPRNAWIAKEKATFPARWTLRAPCLLLQWNLKHKGADLQGDTKTLTHTNIHTHDSLAYFTEDLISECKHVLNHTHTLTFRRNRCVFSVLEVCMTSGRGETSPDEKHMVPRGAVLQKRNDWSIPDLSEIRENVLVQINGKNAWIKKVSYFSAATVFSQMVKFFRQVLLHFKDMRHRGGLRWTVY